jgi:hypothetical protein
MICLRVLARTGRLDCMRLCASFPPSSGYTDMSILCVMQWRSARVVIEWLCTQERWNPQVAITFGTAARYRRATFGSSHDDAHPDNSTLYTRAVRPHSGFVENLFFVSPRTGHGSKVLETLLAFLSIWWARACRAWDDSSIFFSGPIGFPSGVKFVDCLNGLALLESHGASSPWRR